jgi:hypothetical protein
MGRTGIDMMSCGFITPKVAPGDDCAESWECVGGYCAESAVAGHSVCLGQRKADGQICQSNEECAAGSCAIDRCAPRGEVSLCAVP